jgi:hypothetical protein
MSVVGAAITLSLPTDFPSYRIKSEITPDKNEVTDKINFLLCESCFWCASFFNVYREVVSKCPSCNSSCVESMPISHNEVYTFNHDPKRGVILGFSKWRSQLV